MSGCEQEGGGGRRPVPLTLLRSTRQQSLDEHLTWAEGKGLQRQTQFKSPVKIAS